MFRLSMELCSIYVNFVEKGVTMKRKLIYALIGFSSGVFSFGNVVSASDTHVAGEWKVVKEANCLEEGKEIRKCKTCGKVLDSKIIPELGHNYVDLMCTNCGVIKSFEESDNCIILEKGDMCDENGIVLNTSHVTIPEKIKWKGKEYTVVGLAQCFFMDYADTLESVELPDSIVYLEAYCFNMCSKLKSINLPSKLRGIDDACFQCCSSIEYIDIPDSVEYIGNFAFNHLTGLKQDTIHLPKNLKRLGEFKDAPAHMFYDCGVVNGLKHFTIDESNKYYKVIDDVVYTADGKTVICVPRGKVFKGDVLELPDTVENLGELSIGRNTGASTLVLSNNMRIEPNWSQHEIWSYNNFGNKLSAGCYVHSGIKYYKVKPNNRRYSDDSGLLYSKDYSRLVAVPNEYKGTVNIIEGCTSIEDGAFWYEVEDQKGYAMNKITSIVFPSTMGSISDYNKEIINQLVDTYETKLVSNSSSVVINSIGHIE